MRLFLRWLRESFRSHGVSLFAYCLMTNHFHFLAATANTPIGVAMHKLLTTYALFFNRRYARVGHLFQGRFHTKPCRDLAHLIQAVTYIHLNPVKAGLCPSAAAWRWSSHAELVSDRHVQIDLGRLTDLTGMSPAELKERYLERLEIESTKIPAERPPLAAIVERVLNGAGLDQRGLSAGKRGDYTLARRAIISEALQAGYAAAQIARVLSCSKAAVTQLQHDS